MAKVIGIDLGTTNSCMAVLEANEATVIPNAEGGRVTPSVVAFSKSDEVLVGEIARRQAITNPDRTIRSIKRDMGSSKKTKIGTNDYSPQQISAFILQKLKIDAESYLGDEVKQAVITVPAYFEDAQRQATKDSGKIAGLEVLRIINEPTAASLAYGLEKDKDQKILVFDLGGGTFDVSVLEIGDGTFEVKATSGNNHLGGDDYDERIIKWMADDFKAKTNIDLTKDKQALQRLKEAAEKAKIELSQTTTTSINLPFITVGEEGPQHLDITLSRADFQKMTAELVEKCRGPLEQAIKDARVTAKDLDHIILVGGATRMPAVQELVKSITGKDPHKGVNPDEVVAMGAAIQAGHLAGDLSKDIRLLDVTPLSLGIETLGGVMTRLIERNTTIPTEKKEIFTTADDNQTQVEINVLQGERDMAANNKSLGRFHLVGIPPAPRGVPQVEVTFDIDENGILNVSAKDKTTNKEQKITITGSTRLADDEIDKMVKEAEAHAEEDKKKKEEAEVRNNADNLVYQTEKTLKDLGDKVDKTEKEKIEKAVADLKEALNGSDIEKVKNATDALLQSSHQLSQMLYQQQTQQQQAEGDQAGDSGKSKGDEDVVEGEVVDEEGK